MKQTTLCLVSIVRFLRSLNSVVALFFTYDSSEASYGVAPQIKN